MADFWEGLSLEEAALLEDIKNRLDILYEDEGTDKKLYDILQNGKQLLNDITGTENDYSKPGECRGLLFEYCRYGMNGVLDLFQKNFISELVGLRIESEVSKNATGGI